MTRVIASEWCTNPMREEKVVRNVLKSSAAQGELLAQAEKLAASITAKLATHSRTGELAGSVSDPIKGRGRNIYRYYIVIGKGVAYVLAHEHGRKTNGAYEGFHEIEGELSW